MSKRKLKKLKRRLRKAHGLTKFDLAFGAWAAALGRAPLLRHLAKLGELADQPPLATLCLALLAAGIVRGDARMTRAGQRMLLAFAIATFVKSTLKKNVGRTRPKALLDKHLHRAMLGGPKGRAWESFPSGHTAGAVAVARAFTRSYPQFGDAPMAGALTLGALKVLRGDHYPSDILAGFTFGVLAERLAGRTLAA